MLVLDQKAAIGGQITQPFTPQLYKTHQKVQFNANINGLNTFSAAQQVKVVILQNNRWDNALKDIKPTFVRSNTLEYTMENNLVFPAGKEWRWLDLRSLRLQSDRVKKRRLPQRWNRYVFVSGCRPYGAALCLFQRPEWHVPG
ncbi:MAG: DUF5103 domain-containing protein [Chitinophagaceae bacterium]|nr:DUF5103 domain-containing protein [Chitinophagaceae bacterium]